jgi:nitrogen-specific signal transduction histidine kinase
LSTGFIADHGGTIELDPASSHTRFVVRVPLSQRAAVPVSV